MFGPDRAGAVFLFEKVKLGAAGLGIKLRRSGIGSEGGDRTGPPMAPRRTASAFLAASRASSVMGEPVASIEALGRRQPMRLANGRIEHTHTAQQMILEVEFDLRSFFLNYP